jgi:hypothetical protein
MAPYHAAARGWVAKLPMDYSQSRLQIRQSDTQSFEASSRVKLSYHSDGFAQFSSETGGTIRSGRHADGTPKGLGLMSNPLFEGIDSGPACSVVAWGLQHFKIAEGERKSDIVFRESELVELGPVDIDPYLSTVEIMIFVMPGHLWRKVGDEADGRQTMTHMFPHRSGPIPLKFQVPSFDDQSYVLGVYAERARIQATADTGWQLAGPGWRHPLTLKGEVLNAWYPNPTDLKFDSLDWDGSPDTEES